MDELLDHLQRAEAEAARVVELKYFAGFGQQKEEAKYGEESGQTDGRCHGSGRQSRSMFAIDA